MVSLFKDVSTKNSRISEFSENRTPGISGYRNPPKGRRAAAPRSTSKQFFTTNSFKMSKDLDSSGAAILRSFSCGLGGAGGVDDLSVSCAHRPPALPADPVPEPENLEKH